MKYSVLCGKNVQEKIKTLPKGLNYPIVLKRELETCVRIVETLSIVEIYLAWAKAPPLFVFGKRKRKIYGEKWGEYFQ